MAKTRPSACGRFVVVDDLYVDDAVLERLARWAAARGLSLQDAIQLAVCAFNDARCEVPPPSSSRSVSMERAP